MVPTIVPVYAAVLAFIYIVLSARVIQARRSAKVAIGTRGDVRLERKMRVHANFAEYVPFALLLATFMEMEGRPVVALTFALPRACGWTHRPCLWCFSGARELQAADGRHGDDLYCPFRNGPVAPCATN
jgi:hypothetical protein